MGEDYTGSAKNKFDLLQITEAIFVSCYKYCFNHSFASLSSVKLFIGMGGGFKANKIFMMNFASPGFETIAIAE